MFFETALKAEGQIAPNHNEIVISPICWNQINELKE
jgi:hypothetical protein